MGSSFELWMKSVADVPLVESDSDSTGQRFSVENFVGYEEAKPPRFHPVIVKAEPLEDLFLQDGTVSSRNRLLSQQNRPHADTYEIPGRRNCGRVVAGNLTSLPKLTSLTVLGSTESVTYVFAKNQGCIRLTGLPATFLPL